MKDRAVESQDAVISEMEETSKKDAASMVVAFSLSLLIVLASSIAILYIWKGDNLVIEALAHTPPVGGLLPIKLSNVKTTERTLNLTRGFLGLLKHSR